MSYDLCKRISLDKKNNKISICVASSNLIPKHYDTYEIYGGYKTYNFEDKLLSLYIDMQSGNIQISSINDSTIDFEYALWKTREYMKEKGIDSYEDLYIKRGDLSRNRLYEFAQIEKSKSEDKYEKESENAKKYDEWASKQDKEWLETEEEKILKQVKYDVYGECFEIFKKYLFEKIEGMYKIVVDKYYLIISLGKYNRGYDRYRYTSNEPNRKGLEMSFKKAYLVKKGFGYKNLEIVEV